MELSLSQIELTLCRKLFALICSESSTQKAIYLHFLAITVQLSPHFSLIKQYKQIWVFLKPVSPCNSGIAGIHLYSGPNSTWIGRNWTTIASIWPNLNWLSDSVSVLAMVDLYTPCSDSEDQFLMWPQCALNCLLISSFWVQLSTTHQSGGHNHCLCGCTRVHVRVCGLTYTCVSLQQSVQSVNTAVSGSKTCYCVYVKVLYQRVLPLRNFLVCRN